jgi:DNA-binding response OmpR family regulator
MSEKATILVIEDNEKLLQAVARVLRGAGYDVVEARSLSDARECLAAGAPDVITLDILLPDGRGLDFISEIRQTTDAPVLIITSLGAKDERLKGLKAGGDDYIVKPVDLDEMTARIESFLRREAMHKEKHVRELVKGSLSLDTVAGLALLKGEDMQLAPKEFSVLLFLVQNENKIFEPSHLYEEVWKQPMSSDDHSVKNVVYRLRKKLEIGEAGYTISMSRGKGYRFEKDPE